MYETRIIDITRLLNVKQLQWHFNYIFDHSSLPVLKPSIFQHEFNEEKVDSLPIDNYLMKIHL